MGITPQAVGKHLKKARAAGFLEEAELSLTERGQRYAEKISIEERF